MHKSIQETERQHKTSIQNVLMFALLTGINYNIDALDSVSIDDNLSLAWGLDLLLALPTQFNFDFDDNFKIKMKYSTRKLKTHLNYGNDRWFYYDADCVITYDLKHQLGAAQIWYGDNLVLEDSNIVSRGLVRDFLLSATESGAQYHSINIEIGHTRNNTKYSRSRGQEKYWKRSVCTTKHEHKTDSGYMKAGQWFYKTSKYPNRWLILDDFEIALLKGVDGLKLEKMFSDLDLEFEKPFPQPQYIHEARTHT